MSYVGLSTKSIFRERYRNGQWWSRTHNKYLKRASKKYGKENFSILILEDNIENLELLVKRENFWINKVGCYYPNGYNFPFPDIVEVNGKTYKIKNIRTGEIIEITNLTKFCEDNDIGCSAMNAMLNGRQKISHGYCLPETYVHPIKQTIKTPIILENVISGEVITIINLTDFCNKYNLKYGSISRVVHQQKDRKSYKGWKLPETHLKEKIKYKNLYFVTPIGETIFIENLFNYCREHKICYENMYSVARKKFFQYKGWKLLENKDKEREWKGKIVVIFDKNNNIIEVNNISRFCRENNLSRCGFDRMLNKITKEYKGYKLNEKI